MLAALIGATGMDRYAARVAALCGRADFNFDDRLAVLSSFSCTREVPATMPSLLQTSTPRDMTSLACTPSGADIEVPVRDQARS